MWSDGLPRSLVGTWAADSVKLSHATRRYTSLPLLGNNYSTTNACTGAVLRCPRLLYLHAVVESETRLAVAALGLDLGPHVEAPVVCDRLGAHDKLAASAG